MRTVDRSSPRAPFPWRRVVRLAAAGAITALLVGAVGTGLQLARFGTTLASARDRVQADVRQSFDLMARHLRDMAQNAAPAADDVRLAVDADTGAARRLFERVGRVVASDPSPDVAVTIYANDQRAVAWAGRPSELLADRLREGESWFIAQGALGLRLVYVMPIGGKPTPLGVVVAERALTTDDAMRRPGMPTAGENRFVVPGRLVRVSIALPFEGARTLDTGGAFEVLTPSNERLLTAVVAPGDIELARDALRQGTAAAAMTILAITLLLLCGPVLDWRSTLRSAAHYSAAVLTIAWLVVAARGVLIVALSGLRARAPILSASVYGSPWLAPALGSPLDLLLTVLAAAALVAVAFFALEAWRLRPVGTFPPRRGPGRGAAIALDTAAGLVVGLLLVGYLAFLDDTVGQASVDLVRFSLAPWNSAGVAVHGALVLAHATAIGLGVLVFRAASAIWRRPRRSWSERGLAAVCWLLPAFVLAGLAPAWLPRVPLFVALGTTIVLALLGSRITARYRHGSQAFRLALFTLGLIVPAVAFYPAVFTIARRAKAAQVESRYAEQARDQRQAVQTQLRQTLIQIDRFPGLADLIAAAPSPLAADAVTDRAFLVWQTTSLASYPVTSSVELYGPDGGLVSRFAFNLPDDLRATPRSQERACEWEVYAEVAPFFAEERRVLHAGRALCTGRDPSTARGSIVVHAMLDYENLPFIASRNPYVELLRPNGSTADRREPGGDIEYAVYGWSRTPLYASRDTAWTLDDVVFARLENDRTPVWTTLYRGSEPYLVYLLNDRGGIYALGFPAVSPLGHAVNIAEVTVLGALVAALLLIGGAGFGFITRRAATATSLLQEVRASFYRKLFLAFVAAVVVPVVLLAIVTRAFVADQMRASVEREALRTAFSASRVVEDLVAPRAEQQGAAVDDNLMVWVSRLIDQDSNIFVGARLVATSERNLFASGLLPTRTQADVYRALQLHREGATVVRERVGNFEYLVAAAPLALGADDAVLTVPLTSRQRDIDAEVDALDRRVVLVALLFMLGGAGLGYSMAERIADPVSRLTRATRRIASGDLDAHIARATSADEFRRLVDDFNWMADQLKRQRAELERTNRLEAWAEMARQVAHEIKNPLTPIQLNAEHLRRVHRDRGEPLGPILRECVENILTQVTLLRRIASEFSTFASSPTAKPTLVDVAGLLRDIVEPYRTGLADRVRVDADLPPALPSIHVDRTLVSRAITNVLENALHAMPSGGVLSVSAWASADGVHIRIGDTGSGMDAEALGRAFEPYFSTKASGTGLGLPIAKRNVELNGGRLNISSERDRGTTVELIFPAQIGAVASEAG